MEAEPANLAVDTMKTAMSAMVQAIAPNATVLVPRANPMSDNGKPIIEEHYRVNRLLDMRKEQMGLAEQAEFHLMQALWELRGSFSLEDMVRWTGWSRQTIYNKWDKHGLKRIDNAKSPRD